MVIPPPCMPALLLTFLVSASLALAEDPSHVLSLDASNISETIAKHKFFVVAFYSPRCGYCKKLAPEYTKAASMLTNDGPPIAFAKVDVSAEPNEQLADMFELRGLPALKIARDGGKRINDYKGPHDADGMVEYLRKQLGNASAELKAGKDFSNHVASHGIFILGIFPEFSGEEFESFLTVADKRRADYDFGHILSSDYFQHKDPEANHPLVRLFRPFDEPIVDFRDFDVDNLEKCIDSASLPLVITHDDDPRNQPYIEKFFDSENAKVMLYLRFSNGYIDAFRSDYHEVAKQYKGKNMSFLIGNLDSSQGYLVLQHYRVKQDQVPFILIQQKENQKYLIPNVKPDQIATSLEKFSHGGLERFVKSQPVPKVNTGPVKVVVANNFDQSVFDAAKNVLVEFYVPQCSRCKNLAPILEQVATSFGKDSDVIIMKMDIMKNDIPDGFEVKNLPTLYLSSACGKLVLYEGDRTREDIVSFIEKNRDLVHGCVKDEL